jgi:ABC-type branched-subunit amino acid transport system substrate-binding protein
MQCPQCGYLNNPSDAVCAQCGAWLPPTAEADPSAPLPDLGAASGVWERGADPDGAGGQFSAMPPDPFGAAQGMATQGMGDVGDLGPMATAPWLDAPWAPPSAQSAQSAQSALGASGQFPAVPYVDVGEPYGSPYGDPYGGPYGTPYQGPFGGPTNEPWAAGAPARALIVRPPDALDLSFGAPGFASEPLGLGTLLKGGRYRLLQPFALAHGSPAPEGEPVLMIASDTEVPNTRVLVQELPVGAPDPADAEYLRQIVAQRLVALSYVPGLARLVDSFSERRRQFLVFELPSGDLLSDRLQRMHGHLPEQSAVNIALQMLDLLTELERESPPIVHGNICPAHIVLRPSGQIALVGISSTLLLHPDGQVRTGPAGGVPGYSAPEQQRGHASTRSDLYAVCALLYVAVTGTPAARGGALYQPARHINPEVSLELDEALSRGLRPSPAQRFQSVAELRAALRAIASGRRTIRPPEARAQMGAAPALVPMRDATGRFVLPRQPLLQRPLFLAASVFILIVIAAGALYELRPRGVTTVSGPDVAARAEGAMLFDAKGIGLSGGEYIFDTQRPDNDLKQQAARALVAGDASSALRFYTQATTVDPADAEAAIYAANLREQQTGSADLTLVTAVAFGNGALTGPREDDAARGELQGVALAQQLVNTTVGPSSHLRLRVLILNSGPAPSDVAPAAKVLLDEAQAGVAQRVLGIVGWPAAAQTQAALGALAAAGWPLISPTASADSLASSGGTLFTLTPTDSTQASQLADAARQLNARRIAVLADPNDPVSTQMAHVFANRVQHQYAGTMSIVRQETFTTDAPNDYAGVARRAHASGADLVYLAGDDQDAVALAQAVVTRYGTTGLHVLVGPRADTPALRGLGDNPIAALVRSSPDALGPLYVGTLANAGEWDAVGASASAGADFATSYTQQFGAQGGPAQLGGPPAGVILAYDAAHLLVAAASATLPSNMSGRTTLPSQLDPAIIQTALHAYDANHPFMGIGGAIAFGASSGQASKALGILRFAPATNGPPGQQGTEQATVVAVVGGKEAFCGQTSCQPS